MLSSHGSPPIAKWSLINPSDQIALHGGRKYVLTLGHKTSILTSQGKVKGDIGAGGGGLPCVIDAQEANLASFLAETIGTRIQIPEEVRLPPAPLQRQFVSWGSTLGGPTFLNRSGARAHSSWVWTLSFLFGDLDH